MNPCNEALAVETGARTLPRPWSAPTCSPACPDVPDSVMKAYGLERLHFGPDYLIPKPFDHRVLVREAAAVAKAAVDTGVA